MTTLTTAADILDWMLLYANEPTDGTSEFHPHAIACLNRAYREIWTGGSSIVPDLNEPWLWLKKDPPGVLTLNPVITAGTVNVTQGSATVTFSSGPVASAVGKLVKVDTHPDIFRIIAHLAGNGTATLDSPYTGPTNAAATYKLMQLEYSLASDVLRIISPMRVYKDNKQEVDGVDLLSLERDYPLGLVESGTPDCFAMVTDTKVRFNRYGGVSSTDFLRVEYDYLQKPSAELDDSSVEPLVPLEQRQVLADLALMYLLRAKADNRETVVGAQAKAGIVAMADDNQAKMTALSRSFGVIRQRASQTMRYQRVLRTSSGVIIG